MSEEWSVRGKFAIVTGSNTGIGKVTVLELAKLGAAKVIMACRNLKLAEEAAEDIRQKLGFTSEEDKARIAVKHLDLASLASVRRFAEEVKAEENRLDILINNAGINPPEQRQVTEDGLEMTFQVNYLAQSLLTNLLLDLLEKSGYNIDDPQFERRKFDPWQAYSQSKVAFLMYCRRLAQRLNSEQKQVSIFSVHPGMVKSDITRHRPKWFQFLADRIAYPLNIVIPTEDGALTTLFCATKAGLEQYSGGYFKKGRHVDLWSFVKDDEKTEKLWKMSEELWNKQ